MWHPFSVVVKWLKKQNSASNYNGRPCQAHWVFIFSADTHTESGDQPWAKPPDANNFDHIVEFMGQP